MSRGFSHTLQDNKACERPSHVLFADVESYLHTDAKGISTFEPFLWTMYYKRYRYDGKPHQINYFQGDNIAAFWDIVEDHTWQKKKTYLVTHHLEVDFMPMQGFRQLLSRGWTFNKLICNGRVLTLYYSKGKAKLTIMNNGNLFESSIEAWGKTLGVPKLCMPNSKASLSDWATYCERDTRIVMLMWDTLFQFLDDNNLGNWKSTRASLAMTAFKHRFMHHPISIHNDSKAVVHERRAYKGGRFEALKFGDFTDGPFYEVDVTSMYAFIESWAPLPRELRGYQMYPSWKEFQLRLDKYAMIATVDLSEHEPCFPELKDKKVHYGTAPCRTTLCSPELKYALKRGWIHSVIRMVWYYKAPVLRDFARFFIRLKAQYEQQDNVPMRQLAKIYPNAVYGKLAQRGFDDKVIGTCDPDIIEIGEILDVDSNVHKTLYKYGGKVHLVKTTPRSRDSFVAIAAHITAYARMYLWRLMRLAGLSNVFHVATDSLTVNAEGFANLQRVIHPSKPGTLKVSKVYSTLSVRGINDTLGDGVLKCKGIPKKATQLDENTFIITEWPKLTSLIRAKHWDSYYTRERTKVLARPDYYRVLGIPNPSLRQRPQTIDVYSLMTHEESEAAYQHSEQIYALKRARVIPHNVVFALWDYRKGDFKQARNYSGQLVALDYTASWGNLHELGFADTTDVRRAVQTQVSIDKQIQHHKNQLSLILSRASQRTEPPDPDNDSESDVYTLNPPDAMPREYLDLPLFSLS